MELKPARALRLFASIACLAFLGLPQAESGSPPWLFEPLDMSLATQTVAGFQFTLKGPGPESVTDPKRPSLWNGPIEVRSKGRACILKEPELVTELAVIDSRILEVRCFSGSNRLVEFYDLKTCKRIKRLGN